MGPWGSDGILQESNRIFDIMVGYPHDSYPQWCFDGKNTHLSMVDFPHVSLPEDNRNGVGLMQPQIYSYGTSTIYG